MGGCAAGKRKVEIYSYINSTNDTISQEGTEIKNSSKDTSHLVVRKCYFSNSLIQSKTPIGNKKPILNKLICKSQKKLIQI